jgi:hypothetical protein
MGSAIAPNDIADAFSDVHLVASRFEGATVSSDGASFSDILDGFSRLQDGAADVAEKARSPRWQTDMSGGSAVIRRIADDRRERRPQTIRLDEEALPSFARKALSASRILGERVQASAGRAFDRFSQANVSVDGGKSLSLVGEFGGSVLRLGRPMAVGFAFVAGLSSGVVSFDASEAPAAIGPVVEAAGPSDVIVRFASLKIEQASGTAEAIAFFDGAEAVRQACLDAAGRSVHCHVSNGIVSFNYQDGRYEVRDPLDHAHLLAFEEDGVLTFDDPENRHQVDITLSSQLEALAEDVAREDAPNRMTASMGR